MTSFQPPLLPLNSSLRKPQITLPNSSSSMLVNSFQSLLYSCSNYFTKSTLVFLFSISILINFFYLINDNTSTPPVLDSPLDFVYPIIDIPQSSSDSPYHFKIHIFTYNRLSAFQRLWKSLLEAKYDEKYDIQVIVHCDAGDSIAHEEIIRFVTSPKFLSSWPFGSIRINNRFINAGLKASILEAWFPAGNDPFELAFFFEDDISVSPYYFQYTLQALDMYYDPENSPIEFVGISLYAPKFDQITMHPFLDPEPGPYLLQVPCSWGQLFFPKSWRYFIQWLDMNLKNNPNFDPLIPDAKSNTWPIHRTWKKNLIGLMWEKGWYMLYHKLEKELSFSTNNVEAGTNEKNPGTWLRDNLRVPLLQSDHLSYPVKGLKESSNQNMIQPDFTPFDQLPIYTVYHKPVSTLPQLIRSVRPPEKVYSDDLKYFRKLRD